MTKTTTNRLTKSLWRRWRRNYLSPSIRPRFSRKADRSGGHTPTDKINNEPTENKLPSALNKSSKNSSMKLESPSSPTPNEEDNSIAMDMTPKQMTVNTTNDLWSLTPPSSSPAPLVVSAKRLASEIRFKHSKRHRGRLADRTNTPKLESSNNMMEWREDNDPSNVASTSNSSDDEEEEEDSRIDVSLLSPIERSQYYWKICYGSTNPLPQEQMKCWSAQRAPTKSCLSSTKIRRRTSFPCSLLPQGIPNSTPTLPPRSNSIAHGFRTPLLNSLTKERKVQFGELSAAEFNRDAPTSSAIKPLTLIEARQRFSPTKNIEDESTLIETKSNSKILAQWEDDFDDYLTESEDEEEDDASDDDNISFVSNPNRGNRRSSIFFSPTGQNLLAEDDVEKQEGYSVAEKKRDTRMKSDECNKMRLGDIEGFLEQPLPVGSGLHGIE